MSYVQLSKGVSQVVYLNPSAACGPGSPELSKSYSDNARKYFIYIYR